MAMSHGMVSHFSVEDSAGSTLRTLTTYITDVEFPLSQDVAETTTKGQTAKTYVQGHTDATITINGRWDNTVTTGPDVVLFGLVGDAGTVGFEFGPEGNTNGDVKYSGECILTGYSVSSPLADVVGFTAEFQITGAVTKGTFSA
jgi:hypothetical protein